jgi:urease accessory protein
MYADALRSDPVEPVLFAQRQRAEGRIGLGVERLGTRSRQTRVSESGSARVRFPRPEGNRLDAVLINTGGGICCGDCFDVRIGVGAGAQTVVATPAAEKVYRSDGAVADVSVGLSLASGAEIEWLPQETILFDEARLRRRLTVEMTGDSKALLFEAVTFGRSARGEAMRHGLLNDAWRVTRDGRLVYADTLRLTGPVAALLDRPALGGGARAAATCLYAAADAESRVGEARSLLAGCRSQCGASAWDGLLVVRFLAASSSDLRLDAVRFLEGFRGCPLPRVWQS